MRLKTPLHLWSTALFTTLGLAPMVACSGTVVSHDRANEPDGGPGGRGAGGRGSGGAPVSGAGPVGTGGQYVASGGTPGAGGELPHFIGDCSGGTPRLGPDGKPTGFLDCEFGNIARVAPARCGSKLPRSAECAYAPACDADGGCVTPPGQCRTDSDCNEAPEGQCVGSSSFQYTGDGWGTVTRCGCQYGCVEDSDCNAGNICLCGETTGRCVPSTCTARGDCVEGSECLSYHQNYGGFGFACTSPFDRCMGNPHCEPGTQCFLDQEKTRTCQEPSYAVDGRPFLVGGAARVANAVRREDWKSDHAPDLHGLSGAERAALARHWRETALMEHASIAAFARFGLELLSLGAPPELVAATNTAMADETRHARAAFALASAYAGLPIGPGALDVGASLGARTPFDIVQGAILEGCIGETVAAVEAAEALARATDPAVKDVLSRVTAEESQHAELAWRFVRWVLESGERSLRERTAHELVRIVERELVAERRRGPGSGSTPSRGVLGHGYLGEEARRAVRRRVLEEIVLPCARALVARASERALAEVA